MTENKIKLIGALVGAAIVFGFVFAMYGLVSACGPGGVPRDEITEYYNNDSNYRTVIGQIVEYEDENYIFDAIKISTGDIEYVCDLPLKSADILRRNEFDFSAGGVYKFTIGDPYYPQNGYVIVAVRSVMGSREYLSYDVGKANLIKIYSDTEE